MIDNRNFLNAVKEPYLNDQVTTEELRQVVNDYPFFETAWLLLSRNLKLENREEFQNVLKKTAIRAHSRENLFNFIHAESLEKQQPAGIPGFNLSFSPVDEPENLLEHERGTAVVDYFSEEYKPEAEGGQKVTDYFSGEHSFYDWLERIENKKQRLSIEEKKSGGEDLIDRFLKTRPEPIKAHVDDPEKYDEENGEKEPGEIIYTETMAQIYTSQKLFDKAIAVYENLRLKNPEKSSYFAEQIEKLKKLT